MYNIPVVNRNITHKLRSSTDRCVVPHIARSSILNSCIETRMDAYYARIQLYVISHRSTHTVTQRSHSLYVRARDICINMCMDGMVVTIHRIWTPQYDCILNLIHALIKIEGKKYIIQLIFVCHSSESGAFLLLNFYLFAFVWWPLLLLLPSLQYFNRTNICHLVWRRYVGTDAPNTESRNLSQFSFLQMPKGLLNWR